MEEGRTKFRIELRNEGFECWLIIFESNGFELNDLAEELKKNGISKGIKGDFVKNLAQQGFPFGQYLIAEGKLPISGSDSYSECLVDIVPEPPRIETDPDSKTNYVPIFLTNVYAGQKLAKFYPATKGTPGITIMGREIPPMPGKTISNPKGLNTEFLESNVNFLIAKKDGYFYWDGEKARVETDHSVNGDLSLLNGKNIDCVGNLKVLGDVKGGIKVKIGGDLTVFGALEDAKIECDGNVVIKGGIFGSGNGEINCKGSVTIDHAYNFVFNVGEELVIHKEVVTCQIFAKNIISERATLLGGTITARNSIEIKDVGKEQYARTSVTIGGKNQSIEILQNMDTEILSLEREIKDTKDKIFVLAKEKMGNSVFSEDKEELLQHRRIDLDRLIKNSTSLKEKRNKLIIEVKQYNPRLIVHGAIYQNVHLSINDISMITSTPHTNMTFYEKNNEIVKLKNDKF